AATSSASVPPLRPHPAPRSPGGGNAPLVPDRSSATKRRGGTMDQTQPNAGHEPLSDLAYDMMTIVQNKSKGLQAYQQYISDAETAQRPECAELIRKIAEDDRRHVEESTQHLKQVLSGEAGGGPSPGAQTAR